MPVAGNSPLPMCNAKTIFQNRFSTRTVQCFSRSKLGILMIPRLPDVKPPCLTRRAFWPGVFFGHSDSLALKRSLCGPHGLGRSAAGSHSPQVAQAIDVEGFPPHM